MGSEKKQIKIQMLRRQIETQYNFIETEKKINLFLNSFSLLEVPAMYFSTLIFLCTSETISSNWYIMVFKALQYKKYLPKIMRWLRANSRYDSEKFQK